MLMGLSWGKRQARGRASQERGVESDDGVEQASVMVWVGFDLKSQPWGGVSSQAAKAVK